jgi:hypothetical protein
MLPSQLKFNRQRKKTDLSKRQTSSGDQPKAIPEKAK